MEASSKKDLYFYFFQAPTRMLKWGGPLLKKESLISKKINLPVLIELPGLPTDPYNQQFDSLTKYLNHWLDQGKIPQ